MNLEFDRDSQLLFIDPRHPNKSFTYPYSKETASSLLLKNLFKAVETEKQHYFKIVDAFGRELPETSTLDKVLPLQPFYIAKMIPNSIILRIKMPGNSDEVVFLDVDPMGKIAQVEEYIQKTKGIHKKQQTYFIGECQINHYFTLMFHKICKSFMEIRLVLKPKMTIIWERQSFEVYVKLSESISTMNCIIEEKTGVDSDRQLLSKGYRELERKETFNDLGLKDGDVLTLSEKVIITFSLAEWKTKEYHLASNKISEIKRQLSSCPDLFQAGDKLFDLELQGTLLEDERYLSDYTFDLNINLKVVPKEDTLIVRLSKGTKTVHMLIQESCSIGYLKRHFVDINENGIRIFYDKTELDVHAIIGDFKNQTGVVELQFDLDYYGEIHVKSLSNDNFRLKITSHDTGLKIKQKIQKLRNIPASMQRLIFKNRRIDDHKDLAEHMILCGSTIHFMLNLGDDGPRSRADTLESLDISSSSETMSVTWSNRGPVWHSDDEAGLCLEGKCTNLQCKAHGQWVIVNKGFGTYDAVLDEDENKCPLCKNFIKVDRCWFRNCHYTYSGVLSQGEGCSIKKVTSQREIRVEGNYTLLDQEIVGKGDWLTLKIVTKKLNYNYRGETWCSICTGEIHTLQKGLKCNHMFHKKCLEKIGHLSVECVVCHL